MNSIPLHSLVMLMGVTLSGKTTWCSQNFDKCEVLSVQDLRQELTGRQDNYTQDKWVWQELYRRAHVRMQMGQRVVVDSTNLKKEDVWYWREQSQHMGMRMSVVLFDPSQDVLLARAQSQNVQEQVVQKQLQLLRETLTHINKTPEWKDLLVDAQSAQVVHMNSTVPDRLLVVGDVHGNLAAMKWAVNLAQEHNRHLVWLGDVVDYGHQNLACVKLAHTTVSEGRAHMIWGNHERKIDRWIQSDWGVKYPGRLSDANWQTVREIQSLNSDRRTRFLAAWRALCNWSTQHVVKHNWCMTHGAAHAHMWHTQAHRLPGQAGNMAFFGEVIPGNHMKEDGYPNRTWSWVNQVPTGHTVVVGHDYLDRVHHEPVLKENAQGGRVLCIDTGCSKGGVLTAVAVDTDTHTYEVFQHK